MVFKKLAPLGLLSLALCGCANVASTQWGSANEDVPDDIAVDEVGNSFVTYSTYLSGGDIPYLRYLDASGNTIREIQLDFTRTFYRPKVAVSGAGVVYVTGPYLSGTNWGGSYLQRYDASGRLLGTTKWQSFYAIDVGVNKAGQVFVAGYGQHINDPRIATFDANGTLIRNKAMPRIGSQMTFIRSLNVDPLGLVRVAGEADDNLDALGNDLFMMRYHPGVEDVVTARWNVGGPGVVSTVSAITADSYQRVAVTGESALNDDPNISQAFLTRLGGGTQVWGTTIWGTPRSDRGGGVGIDSQGTVYVAGTTSGDLGAPVKYVDAFITRLDFNNGAVLGSSQWGTSDVDYVEMAVIDKSGKGYVLGATYGNMAATPKGERDIFVSRVWQ